MTEFDQVTMTNDEAHDWLLSLLNATPPPRDAARFGAAIRAIRAKAIADAQEWDTRTIDMLIDEMGRSAALNPNLIAMWQGTLRGLRDTLAAPVQPVPSGLDGLPERVVVGKNGAYWRDFTDDPDVPGSMCPVSTDNDPIEPVAVYVRVANPPDPTSDEPTTANGRDLLDHAVQYNPADADRAVVAAKIIAIENEAALTPSQPVPSGLDRQRVLAAMHRIVVNELPGVPSWQVELANRLTNAALAAAPAPEEGAALDDHAIIALARAVTYAEEQGSESDMEDALRDLRAALRESNR